MTKYKSYYESPVGMILLESDGKYLTALQIKGQRHYEEKEPERIEKNDLLVFQKAKKWLEDYFNKKNPSLKIVPLKYSGSAFQERVWYHLLKIPYGSVVTHKSISEEVAKDFGKEKMSAQAVGKAVGKNPISIIIPCHRVVGTNNNLTGYNGGIDKKIKLLEIEGIDSTKYQLPKGPRV